MTSRIVVTGATGNVGSCLIDRLLDDPRVEQVIGIARRPEGRVHPKLTSVTADIVTAGLPVLFEGADAVVHLAWHMQPTHDPRATWVQNTTGSSAVFEAAASAGVRTIVYASSVGAYSPGPADRSIRVDEAWPTDGAPESSYSREKAYVERLLDAFEARHREVRVVRLRPAFIFGRDSASEQRRIMAGPFLPNWIVKPGLLPVIPWPRGLCIQTVHVDDVVEAFRTAVFEPVRGAFNVAAEPVIDASAVGKLLRTRTIDVAPKLVRAAVATMWHLRLVPAEPGLFDLVFSQPLLDTTRIRDELGWHARRTSIDALQAFLAGVAAGAGRDTVPLAPDSPLERMRELRTRMGAREAG